MHGNSFHHGDTEARRNQQNFHLGVFSSKVKLRDHINFSL
jgi:hypothetical protein